MADINPNLSVITLNVNRPKLKSKVLDWKNRLKKKRSNYMLSIGHTLNSNTQLGWLKVKG